MSANCGSCVWGYAPCCDCYLGKGCRSCYTQGTPLHRSDMEEQTSSYKQRIEELERTLQILLKKELTDEVDCEILVERVLAGDDLEDILWEQDWDHISLEER